MKRRPVFITVLSVLMCLAAAAHGAEPSQAQLEEEFRQTLLRLAQAGELPDATMPVVIERPAERVSDFGLLVDRDHADGLLVLGTLPGGSAERMGLRTGDRLLAANDIDLRGNGGSGRMRELLDDPDSNGRMALHLLRGGQEQHLVGTVDSVTLPAMRIELVPSLADADVTDRVAGDPDSRCGRITVEPVAPRARNLFPARLISVDGELPGPASQETYRLTPGRHVLIVAEMIEQEYFSNVANLQRGRQSRNRYKILEVDIQPGVTYYLAARFHRDRGNRILEGSYWQPALWKERAEPCR